MPGKIKVFHLEDYKIMRDGVKHLLGQDAAIEIVGEASQGDELTEMLKNTGADVLITDLYLDGMEDIKTQNAFEICKTVHKKLPHVKIIAHSVYDDADRIARIMQAGAMGFVSKKAGYEELIIAVKAVFNGKKYICKETSKKLKNLTEFLEGIAGTLKSDVDFFSAREKMVLQLLAKGNSSRQIAKELFITEKTVESHRRNMAKKAKVKNTVELVAYASAKGLLKR